MDYGKVIALAQEYRKPMSDFLRDMIRIPSESCEEEKVILRIREEMEKVGFDEVRIDAMGNIIGRIGDGPRIIAFDAHIDTVGVGNADNWKYDPYAGHESDEIIVGRGASDQEGGMASMIYAVKIMKELDLLGEVMLYLTGTVMEEDCDGLCWQYLIEEENLRPEFVLITEPTSLNIYRGQRGRMEIKVETAGISSHGSAPERGDNAIYKMAPILMELQELNNKLHQDAFLGKGSLTVSEIFHSSPSRCAVADGCRISIDRRLTDGETWQGALGEIENLQSVRMAGAKVSLYDYKRKAYTGLIYPTKCYFPTWVIPEDHVAVKALQEGYRRLFGKDAKTDRWTFSTNGVSIMGRYHIPCVGFGPGHEEEAHAPDEKTWKDELVAAAALYAVVPKHYLEQLDVDEL